LIQHLSITPRLEEEEEEEGGRRRRGRSYCGGVVRVW